MQKIDTTFPTSIDPKLSSHQRWDTDTDFLQITTFCMIQFRKKISNEIWDVRLEDKSDWKSLIKEAIERRMISEKEYGWRNPKQTKYTSIGFPRFRSTDTQSLNNSHVRVVPFSRSELHLMY